MSKLKIIISFFKLDCKSLVFVYYKLKNIIYFEIAL